MGDRRMMLNLLLLWNTIREQLICSVRIQPASKKPDGYTEPIALNRGLYTTGVMHLQPYRLTQVTAQSNFLSMNPKLKQP
jgi:hypothetical protein